jgi:hypothetical protein
MEIKDVSAYAAKFVTFVVGVLKGQASPANKELALQQTVIMTSAIANST